METNSELHNVMKENNLELFEQIINILDFTREKSDLRFLTHPEFLQFLKIYFDLSVSSVEQSIQGDIFKYLILNDNLPGIELFLERYPAILSSDNSEKYKIIQFVMATANYPIYLRLVSEYPTLMDKNNSNKCPIEFLSYDRDYILEAFPWHSPSNINIIESHEMIFKHHIENYNNVERLSEQYKIPSSLHEKVNEFLMIIVNKIHNEDLLTRIFLNNIINFRRRITLETTQAYIDAGIHYTFKKNLIVRFLASRGIEFLNFFVNMGYVPDIRFLHRLMMEQHYDMFKYVYHEYQYHYLNPVNDISKLFESVLWFSHEQFLEILDYPNMDILIKHSNHKILHYIFSQNLSVTHQYVIIKKLLDKGLDPHDRNFDGSCFFHSRLSYDDIKTLQNLGVNLATQDNSDRNRTVLMILSLDNFEIDYKEYKEIAEILLYDFKFSNKDINKLLDTIESNISWVEEYKLTITYKKKILILHNCGLPLSEHLMEFIET